MEITKYIAKSGFCSKRRAETLIEEGRVFLNGRKATKEDVVKKQDEVKIDNEIITTEGREDTYLVLHKPSNVSLSAESTTQSVHDFLPEGLFYSVSDINTETAGLVVFVSNRKIADKIRHAKDQLESEFTVKVTEEPTRSSLDWIRKHLKNSRIKATSRFTLNVVASEEDKKSIRKVIEAAGLPVKDMRRTRLQNIRLRELGAGNTRMLSKRERRELLSITS